LASQADEWSTRTVHRKVKENPNQSERESESNKSAEKNKIIAEQQQKQQPPAS
jgi:hypothetical protein